ncbi:MAG: FAD-containing oxidoreductase [Hyphomicrobiaceae bacterium]|nr:MAG: FAD-containing oxidoreductase [Hyphomicrobiaceae bacterium]
MATRFDAIVIGTGQSGPPLAAHLASEGHKTAVIERKHYGGTCVNVGCIPTKALVACAHSAHAARRAGEFGVEIGGPVRIDMRRVHARIEGIVKRGRKGVGDWMKGLENTTVIEGHARFEGPHQVRVGEEELSAKWIFINTGGRAVVPDIPGLPEVPYLTNSTIMDLDTLPEHLIILGGSYIGLEFAQIYRRFGARVTVIEMAERLIGKEDEDVSDAVREIMQAEGIEVHLSAECLKAARTGRGVALEVDCGGKRPRIEGSHLLLAVGRRPNTDELGLEKAGIKADKKGHIIVDDQCRTNVEGVWAIGDCNGRGAFTHTSYNDYEIVAANLFENDPRRLSDRITCYALYTDPPLGRAGVTEKEARAEGKKLLVAKLPMSKVGRAKVRSETQGFMKVVVDADSKQVLGAACLGASGDEVIHNFIELMAAGAPYTVMQRAVHIHPTISEYLPTMLASLEPV